MDQNAGFTENMKWERVFHVPTEQQIAQYRNPHHRRSPYLAAWLDIPQDTRYSEYSVEFKVSHLPEGTYCCLGNWAMDYSSLKKRYTSFRTEYASVQAYAGFQRIEDGRPVSIMSFWDVFCQDARGRRVTLAAQRIYPLSVIGGGRFWGEGEGERSTTPFGWQANRWYRMHLKCEHIGQRTYVKQGVWDLETGVQTQLSCFALDIENALMQNSIAVFLENYLPETAGQVRSMEVRNPKYLDAATNRWHSIKSGYVSSNGGLPSYEGSYNFGVSDNRLWMITSGVGGDWFGNGKGKQGMHFTLGDD